MFTVSTKGDYGLQILMFLAKHSQNDYVSLQQIAQEEKLSPQYLAQITMLLKSANLISSKEGKGGGYKLVKPAAEISMLEILEALEGPMTLVRCYDDDSNKSCQCSASCQARGPFGRFMLDIREYFDNITLASVVEEEKTN